MRALFIGILLLPAPALAAAPGEGTRITAELGGARASGTYSAARSALVGRGGITGPAVHLRAAIGFPIARGFFLGPAAGIDWAFTRASSELCCGDVDRVDTARLGLEAAYYPDPRIGFRILAGVGYAMTTLRPNDEGRARPGVLGSIAMGGSTFSLAIARDYRVGEGTRIGGVLRVDADVAAGRTDDHVYTLRTFTPSLSLVVLTHWAG